MKIVSNGMEDFFLSLQSQELGAFVNSHKT